MLDIRSNKLGFGTWQLGGEVVINGKQAGWSAVDEKDAVQVILHAYDRGIRFFDTSDIYGLGKAEQILGLAFNQNKTLQPIICTKFGNRVDNHGNLSQDFSSEWLEESVRQSLNRLNRKNIGVLLFHSPPDSFDWQNYPIEKLEKLKEIGIIQSYGVSSKSVYGAQKVIESNFGDYIEIIYNAIDFRAEKILFQNKKLNHHVIARVPLASGFLKAEVLKENPTFMAVDNRNNIPKMDLNWMTESVRKLSFLNDLPGGISISALRFCLSHSAVSYVIPGMRTMNQVDNFLYASQLGPLPLKVLQKIKDTVPDVPEHWNPISR